MGFEETTKFIDAKADIRDRISVEVGDSKQAKFYPQTKVSRWDNEVNLSMRLVHDEAAPIVIDGGDKVSWEGENQKVEFYEIGPSELHPEGATEIEVTLFERPADDRVQFTINTKGILFYRQPASVDELPEALRKAASPVIPEHIKGSFAVYADEPKTNYEGGKAYKAGKVGHIYRPRMSDANGVEAWGELSIDTDSGLLTVDLDKDFLDKAVYPIRHAAGLTFGYTTVGSGYFFYANVIILQKGTPASAGTISKYSFYTDSPLYGTYQNDSCRFGLYSNGGTTLIDYAAEVTTGTFTGWYDVNSSTAASIAASTNYYVALWSDDNQGGLGAAVAYDFGGPELGRSDAETYGTLTAWPQPHAWTSLGGNYLFSMYVTYTEVAGKFPPMYRQPQAVNRASSY